LTDSNHQQDIYRYDSDWIKKLETEYHWRMYWQQINLFFEHISLEERILEIGTGSGFINRYLKGKNYSVTSIDIDKNKGPDIVGNIVNYNFGNRHYDTILAFEVFEHLPFRDFEKAVKNISNICDKQIFISLPFNQKNLLTIYLKLGRYFEQEWVLRKAKRRITTVNHHWELGYKEFTRERVENVFLDNHFYIQQNKRIGNIMYYHFMKA
jgi:2-polyprenyl-3-methyl-5-hydroxy-6-metoxy-1,4-benzoquinol methylase